MKNLGQKKYIQTHYHKVKIVPSKARFDLSLEVNLQDFAPHETENLIHQLSNLKRNTLGAPLEMAFDALKNSSSKGMSPIQIPFRKSETMFIHPEADRVIVLFSVCFDDKTDQAIARVFLQEMAEAGRRVNNAPPINFHRDPPLELRSVSGLRASDDLVGYLSITVFSSHVSTDLKRSQATTMIQGFRNYLHYHITNTKTYLHMRMRKRVEMLLQVLNRAHPEKDPSKAGSKKTMSGKTFTRS